MPAVMVLTASFIGRCIVFFFTVLFCGVEGCVGVGCGAEGIAGSGHVGLLSFSLIP